ncbi:hypothetical protein BCB4_0265 [Bacillus phage B4]|uniref:DUF7349 domain-containing protein n=2 Tax=Bequatrovirus B4 TaxID=1918005 RepID=J9PRJ4_9CAUD|nr:hypothetical protein BCB4_0265 [Bacillus phage B4]YP_009783856.1 hypothetical protein QLX26_gp260 [Bacillus phage B5S]MEB9013846.1 hypothetical protein [Bacillus cereus]AEW47494.1 hypothetical protein B5S_0260 [Bacillus phage B5S]AEZ66058.1 hypothetical protein BCB4_0265 [Bacillus phage B4]MEB9190539.1 hypothetical protein [Bacillus cereus]
MLVNEQLAGKTVASVYGDITFNEKGEAVDIKPEVEKALAHVQGFTLVEEKPEPKKEAPAKKAPAKKTAPKADKEEK